MGANAPIRPGLRLPDEKQGERAVYAVFAALALVIGIGMLLLITSIHDEGGDGSAAAHRKLPPYWVVKKGDSYDRIAAKTGLTMDELYKFNPQTNPSSIQAGQKIKLRLHVPPPKPKPPGPEFATVRSGDTLATIGARTGHPVAKLLARNPKLKPATLQPGDRVRLRR